MHADAEEDIEHRLLGEEAEPDGDAEQDCIAEALPLHQHHPGVEHDRPTQDQRNVGRDQQRRIGDSRQRGENDRRPEGDPGVIERTRREEDHDRDDGVEDWRGGPDTGFRIAADLGHTADHPSDHRRLGEIAEGELARPCPILRLVEHEIGLGGIGRRKPQSEQRSEAGKQAEEIAGIGDGRARDLTQHDGFWPEGRVFRMYYVVHCGESLILLPLSAYLPRPDTSPVHAYFRCHPSV